MTAPGPGGYAAWVGWIEAFRRGEDPPMTALGPISGRLGSYVEARVLDRLSAAFTTRVRQWQTALGDAVVTRPPDGPVAASAMLRDAVVRLDPLVRLATSALLPRSLGASMDEMLGQVRDGARTALDDAWRRRAAEGDGEVPVQRGPDAPRTSRARGGAELDRRAAAQSAARTVLPGAPRTGIVRPRVDDGLRRPT